MPPVPDEKRFELTKRLAPLFIFFLLFLLTVLGKILYLQVGMGQQFKKLSAVNRITHETIPASRGRIVDKAGRLLAADQPVFQLVRLPGTEKLDEVRLQKLAEVLEVSYERLTATLTGSGSQTVLRELSDAQRIRFEEQSSKFPGLKVEVRPRRVYHHPKYIGPIVGYTGEVSPSELTRRRREGLSQGDVVGKAGVEKFYDSLLRGRSGLRWVETSAAGEHIRTLDSPEPIPPEPGENIQLNIDLALQKRVFDVLETDSEAAVVVQKIPSGRLRALVSRPSYDPNDFTTGGRKYVRKLLREKNDPLVNRAVHGRYPPGSTFKILPFVAAMKDEGFDWDQVYNCPGFFELGTEEFECWKEDGHGRLNLSEALVHSCNVYFYNLALDIDYSGVEKVAENLNYTGRTGIDLPGEKRSQLSTPRLLKDSFDLNWTDGELLNAVIGQGYTLVTPLRQAAVLGALLTGQRITPRLVGKKSPQPLEGGAILSATERRRLIDTLEEVAATGTGYWAQHDRNYQVVEPNLLGKTGTVQKVKRDDEEDTPASDAWFVSAAPVEEPEYVVVVFLKESGSGGQVAAPVARRVYQAMVELDYFDNPSAESRRETSASRAWTGEN